MNVSPFNEHLQPRTPSPNAAILLLLSVLAVTPTLADDHRILWQFPLRVANSSASGGDRG